MLTTADQPESPQQEPVKDWPHAPIHRLDNHGVYIITAGTHCKQHFFNSPEKLTLLESTLLTLTKQSHWQLEAWAVFSNHYHFVARSLPEATDLGQLIKQLHANTARALNRLDQTEGRAVWYNFWDTKLTYQQSYLARLNMCIRIRSSTGWRLWQINIIGVPRPGLNGSPHWRRSRPFTVSRRTR